MFGISKEQSMKICQINREIYYTQKLINLINERDEITREDHYDLIVLERMLNNLEDKLRKYTE